VKTGEEEGRNVDKELRTNICRLIAGLVVTDDDLDPTEEAFLDKLLAKFEIPASERDAIFPIIDRDEAAQTIRALPADAQKAALELLIEATVADGIVKQEERDYLDVVALELGVAGSELERRIAAQLGSR
jgi:uncharacterized tellurite resistance protein B-like protein